MLSLSGFSGSDLIHLGNDVAEALAMIQQDPASTDRALLTLNNRLSPLGLRIIEIGAAGGTTQERITARGLSLSGPARVHSSRRSAA